MKNKSILFLINFVFVICLFSSVSAAEREVDKVVARVNEDVILLSEYSRRANPILMEYERVMTGPDKEKKVSELKENILEQMIDEKLLLQKAKKEKIYITDAEVDQGIDEIRNRFTNEVEFRNEISKQGFKEDGFRDNVKNQLSVIKLINQNVRGKIAPPTEKEIGDYYKEHESEMVTPEQVRVRHILVKVNEKVSQEEAKKKINEIYGKVKKEPSKFPTFAEQYSQGPSAKIGGALDYFGRGEMVKEFEDVAFNLDLDEISKPVKTRFGYHIIKLIGKKSSEKRTYSEVKDRLKSLLYQIKMEKEYEKFLRELRDEAKISKTLDK
jgi:parvulin-like peptidyl-prolyl isomerase